MNKPKDTINRQVLGAVQSAIGNLFYILTNEKNTDILKKSKELLDALIKKYVPAK
jgi:chaperonin cofactor prefoldin